jgi:steroid 5-alpha reductase family enzyme
MVKTSRGFGFFVLLLVYIAAALLGVAVFRLLPGWGFYPRLFAADAAATLLVWLAGLLLRNASVYDPYWSVAPIVLLILGGLHLGALNAGALLLGAAVALWGIRLTAHWSTTFVSLRTQDWRYTMLKASQPRLWFLINLFGINLFPTVVVFLALAPAFQLMLNYRAVNPGILLGLLVCLAAVALQYAADTQMRRFREKPENRGRVNRAGVWKYSRHPNYLGEILMWWGVCLAALSVPGASVLYAIGPLVNTLMFVFISIPMMERRQLRGKGEYADYKAETGMLLPRLGSQKTGAETPKR